MNIGKALLWALPVSIVSSLSHPALAVRMEMRVLPLNGPGTGCPEALTAFETAQNRQEGGYATDGMVQLSVIANNISATQLTDFTAVWTGTLKPEYRNCTATAGIYSKDGETFWGHSHLRVQLADGQAKVILDMTGVRDTNGFTSTIIEQTMRDGNPRWTWGGTD